MLQVIKAVDFIYTVLEQRHSVSEEFSLDAGQPADIHRKRFDELLEVDALLHGDHQPGWLNINGIR